MKKVFFGIGKILMSFIGLVLLRQAIVAGYISKEIESYGVLKITPDGKEYLKDPKSFLMTEDHNLQNK